MLNKGVKMNYYQNYVYIYIKRSKKCWETEFIKYSYRQTTLHQCAESAL